MHVYDTAFCCIWLPGHRLSCTRICFDVVFAFLCMGLARFLHMVLIFGVVFHAQAVDTGGAFIRGSVGTFLSMEAKFKRGDAVGYYWASWFEAARAGPENQPKLVGKSTGYAEPRVYVGNVHSLGQRVKTRYANEEIPAQTWYFVCAPIKVQPLCTPPCKIRAHLHASSMSYCHANPACQPLQLGTDTSTRATGRLKVSFGNCRRGPGTTGAALSWGRTPNLLRESHAGAADVSSAMLPRSVVCVVKFCPVETLIIMFCSDAERQGWQPIL